MDFEVVVALGDELDGGVDLDEDEVVGVLEEGCAVGGEDVACGAGGYLEEGSVVGDAGDATVGDGGPSAEALEADLLALRVGDLDEDDAELASLALRASSAFTIASIVGIPACSVTTSGPAPVPPCIPSTTIISAPAFAAIFTSCSTLPDANFTMIGTFQSVISLNWLIFIPKSSGPTMSICLAGLNAEVPSGIFLTLATSAVTLWESKCPPIPDFAP